jgi:hypothetical protein
MGLSADTLAMLKGLAKDNTTTGISTATQLVYYNLEPTAKRLLPRPTPLRNSIPRAKSPSAGPGIQANWKAIIAADGGIVGAGTGQYPGVSEGHRNAFMSLTERNYTATFSGLGKDIPTTFEAQFAGQGFDDARGIAQIVKLNALMISEEKMIIGGNAGSGTGYNGFQLGTCSTPVNALVAGGSLTTARYVTSYVVALTYWGLQFSTVPGGVVTQFTRTNADGSADTINGGSSAISLASNTVLTTGGTLAVSSTVAAVPGALGYAFYFDVETTNTASLANAKLSAIATVPQYTLLANPVGAQTGAATGLNTDFSANNGQGGAGNSTIADFTGLWGWLAGTVNAGQGGYLKDLGNAQLTANGDGTIAEIETLILNLATNYFLTPETLYCGPALMSSIVNKILTTTTGANAPIGSQRINFTMGDAGAVVGGTFGVSYRSKFAGIAMGENEVADIRLKTHPLLPDNCIFFDFQTNPYPDSNIPAVRRIQTMQEYYSIQWPLRTRQWEIGTYVNELFQEYVPFGFAGLTGVAHA